MALTKVSRGLLSTSIVDNGNATAITIDSSENVGIGESSPSGLLHLKKASDTADIILESSGGSGKEYLIGSRTDGSLNIYDVTASEERLRINASGNLLVGKTTTAIETVGINLFGTGRIISTADGDDVAVLNRKTSDGDIAVFKKDGTTVGSIGSNSGSNLTIGTGDTGIYFNAGSDAVHPWNIGTNAARSGAIDLGRSVDRFKDLYLSGTAKSQGVELEDIKAKDTSGINLQTSNGQKRVVLDNSGNLLVGQTSASSGTVGTSLRYDGRNFYCADGNYSGHFNRKTSDGAIVHFAKDDTVVGSISTYGDGILIGNAVSSAYANIRFTNDEVFPCRTNGNVNDGTIKLGKSNSRWDDIYATNGTIQTSDRNEKQDIAELSDEEQRVAVACKGLLRKFRWKDSVAEKGDEARTHFGIIAQDLQAAFAAEGLDAGDYAMFISSTWTDEETNEEKTRMGVRYSELLAFIIAAI